MKREDQCCPGGPNFSKTRGVYAHIAKRPEVVIGVLDTTHSQGGWAVARACQLLGKGCVEFYPVRKADRGWRGVVQERCAELGAEIIPLPAGRSAVLYHAAKRLLTSDLSRPAGTSYMMPNALKLPEMVEETAAEVARTALPDVSTVIVSASSGTIAAGVALGLMQAGRFPRNFIVHQGYSRPKEAMWKYMAGMMGWDNRTFAAAAQLVDEGYSYADRARPCGVTPPCPMNEFYDLKLFSWWVREGRARYGEALMWNIG